MPDHRAATVEFDHVTKRYDRVPRGPGAARRRQRPHASTVPAGQDLRPGRAVGLRQDDVAQDGQPADRADGGPDPDRRRGRGHAGPHRAAPRHRVRHPADGPVPAPDDRRERRDGAAPPRLDGRAPAGAGRGAARARRAWTRRRTATATRRSSRAASDSGSGVARALAADPPIMLMDEPFGAVDPIVRERLQNEFLRLQEQLAKTILFVTHDIDEAIKMGDLVAVMATGGRLRAVRAAGRDPRPARIGVRRPVRRGGPRPQAAVARRGSRDLALAAGASPRAPATTRPTPARGASSPIPSRTCCSSTTADRPIGWLDAATHSCRRARSTRSTAEPCRRCSTGGRRSRTRCRCCSTRTSRPASWSTATAVPRPRHRRADRGRFMRRHGGELRAAICRAPRPRRRPADGAGSRPSRDRLGAGWSTTSTSSSAARSSTSTWRRSPSSVGFAISFAPGDLVGPPAPALYAPITAAAGILVHDPEPRRCSPRSSRSPGSALAHRRGPARPVHAGDLRAATSWRLRRRAAGRPGGRRRHGLHARAAAAARRAAAGHCRSSSPACGVASVSTIGLVTITGILGDAFGGLGYFIFEGYRRNFPTEICSAAMPVDRCWRSPSTWRSSRVQGRADAVGRGRRGAAGHAAGRRPRMRSSSETIAWLTDPAQLGRGRPASRCGCWSTWRSRSRRSLVALAIALPIGLWVGHTRPRGARRRSTSRTSAARSRPSR